MALRFVPATSTRPPSRSTTSAASCRRCWSGRSSWRSTSRPSPTKGALVAGLSVVALAAGIAFVHPAAPGGEPAVRPRTSPGGAIFWVAACAGIIVFGSLMGAMFIGQQFLQNVLGYSHLPGRAGDPAGGHLHGAGRAALGQAGRGQRRPLHAAYRLCVLPARLPHDAAAVEGGQRLLAGRPGLRADRGRRRFRRHAGLALADRLGAGRARGHGVGHGGPAARPGRRDDAVDLRRAADGGLRGGGRGQHRRRAQRRPAADHQQCRSAAAKVVRRRRGGRRAVSAVRRPDHRRGEGVVPGRRSMGLPRRHHRRSAWRDAGVFLVPEVGRGDQTAGRVRCRGHGVA